ncbi:MULTISPECIES: AAA family ATPase [Gordonia]|uniref:AAA family ATPase n=1 Tax=Gordonia amicalis TaxID=89053 RepID=A0AAE4R1U7_9ACTN|nr:MULTISPECIES: AAA family ATPase [Gordonia]MCZ4577773.1 AAA family ATPase [Gordonia amicalis]MCZ4652393.1 AAA family ATPase [Gordonia amicalis]MDJ0451232.1 AAA family ATPase [Gordonia amicalis]MDV6310597.1 AAA family ATPase [Gordonia amicalis]MDV7074614.1 AAA family ATPase [Gordonia amicalis]
MPRNEKRRPTRKSDAAATVASRGPREQENARIESTSEVGHLATAALDLYLDAGWHCPLPLPEGMKYPPPDDTTGNKPYPDENEIPELWRGPVRPNLGLRMPRFVDAEDNTTWEVIGLDVDDYDDKHGYETLRDLIDELGPLPMTYRSTSRDPDNPSGIRFFLVPADLKWKGKPGRDIEVIQRTHRYAVAWPSETEDRVYRWYDLDEQPMDGPPDVADLPSLPEPWIEHLCKGEAGQTRVIEEIDDVEEAVQWLETEIPGYEEDPSGHMNRATNPEKLAEEMSSGAHDMMLGRLHEVVQLAAEGHHGLKLAISRVRKAFLTETLGGAEGGEARRDILQAKSEWRRALCGEVSKLRADIADDLIRISTVGGYTAKDGDIDIEAFRASLELASTPPTVTDTDAGDDDGDGWSWHSSADLAAPVAPIEYLIEPLIPALTYGVIAGQKKTLKTYHALMMAVAVASGKPFLGRFRVPEPGPVLYVAAEGGAVPFQRRFQAVCAGYGIVGDDMRALPFHVTHDRARMGTPEWSANIDAAIEAFRPRLLIVDSLYNVHASDVETSNLYARGGMLADLSALTENRCALLVLDHFRKGTGGSLDLHDISMSGVGEWADSWVLQRHRADPDLDQGAFWLEVEYGSRQTGGARYGVDITVPPQRDDGTIAPVRWQVGDVAPASPVADLRTTILHHLRTSDGGLTAGQLKSVIPGNAQKRSDVVAELVGEGKVSATTEPRGAGGRRVTVYRASAHKLVLPFRPGGNLGVPDPDEDGTECA